MRYVLIPFTLPMFVIGYLIVAFWSILNCTRQHRFDKKMWTWECAWAPWIIKQRKWLSKNPFGRKGFLVAAGKKVPSGNFWKYSTTFAYGIIYHPQSMDDTTEADTRTERHEDVHIRQGQDELILSFVIGLAAAIGFWALGHGVAGFAWWMGLWFSGVLWRTPNYLGAVLRGGQIYRDSEHERSAYAQTDRWPNGESWIEDHAKRKQDW